MEQVIDETIDELNNKIIPAGKELLNDIAEEPEESTEDPVDRLFRPARERREPDRLTYGPVSYTHLTLLTICSV